MNLLGNFKKGFIKRKQIYFNCDYAKRSNFFPYLRNLLDKKSDLHLFMKKRNLSIKDQGKFEKNLQKSQSLFFPKEQEELEVSNDSLNGVYNSLSCREKKNILGEFNDGSKYNF